MKIKTILLAAVVVPMAFQAQADAGKTLYETNCHVCHTAGVAGAPIFGDKDAWSVRISKGVDALYASSINGLGAMPPKGGAVAASDEDVKAAVDYMIANAQ